MKLIVTLTLLIISLTSLAQVDADLRGTNFGLNLTTSIEFWRSAELVPALTFQTGRHFLYAGPKIVFLYINGVDLGYSYFLKKDKRKFDLFMNYDFQYGKNLLVPFILCPSEGGTKEKDIVILNVLNFGANWYLSDSFYASASIGGGIRYSQYGYCSPSTGLSFNGRVGLGFRLATKKEKGGNGN